LKCITAEVSFNMVQCQVERKQWNSYRNSVHSKRTVEKKIDLVEYRPDKYLLSHVTIIAGVDLESGSYKCPGGDDKYLIRADHSHWVNDNGNAWDNRVLLNTYKSFVMGENYVEHIQRKDLSRGKILDAVARIVIDSENVKTVYVDLLVATNKKNEQLCKAIESGKVNSLSMGCEISHSRCSKCGRVFGEEDETKCAHLEAELKQKFIDENGVRRVVSELCGVSWIKDSCLFTEASWVADPAFGGAYRRNTIGVLEKLDGGKDLQEIVGNYKLVHASVSDKREKVAASLLGGNKLSVE